jgi:hypothetical protein
VPAVDRPDARDRRRLTGLAAGVRRRDPVAPRRGRRGRPIRGVRR